MRPVQVAVADAVATGSSRCCSGGGRGGVFLLAGEQIGHVDFVLDGEDFGKLIDDRARVAAKLNSGPSLACTAITCWNIAISVREVFVLD